MRKTIKDNYFGLLAILPVILLLTGCATSLSSSWTNFRAYYNTYYNAEKNFRAGLEKVNDQPRQINPETPVRIHPEPVQAGDNDFQNAIDKGAKILRKFPDSKYMDDALLLIGRSYYYRQEYYPALQKFEELRVATQDPQMIQKAIIWKGRALLDLKRNNEAISFLENELAELPADWPSGKKGEIQALFGEHHAMLENWAEADSILSEAVSNINSTSLKGRTFFLLGQVLERRQLYSRSFDAYSNVSQYFPGFEYEFWAGMKRADVARKDGNYDLALNLYQNLRRDDKNFERIDRIRFEIALTMEMQGSMDQAEDLYKELLYSDRGINERALQGRVYYRLGKIYSESRDDFRLAAAYFDTASSFGASRQVPGETQSAQSLAEAYEKYNRFTDTVQRADSLLWLGSLPKEKLDSVLTEIRRQKRQELLARQEERSSERLKNKILSSGDQQNTSSSIYGFLNHRNKELVQRGKSEFLIIWGDRPLVDNWRRSEAIQGSAGREAQTVARQNSEQGREPESGTAAIDLNVDAIPRSESEKESLIAQKRNAQYELGNLLFLNLGMYDSARPYFYSIINSDIDSQLRPRAMYSLVELFRETGRADSLQKWRSRILEEYPESRFARRIESRETSVTANADTTTLKKRYQSIVSSDTSHKNYLLRRLALQNRAHELAPYIHFQAIEGYIMQARAHRTYSDSLKSILKDMRTDSLMEFSDDAALKPDTFQMEFHSAYWDSARAALKEFDATFPDAKQRERAVQLLEMLKGSSKSPSRNIPSCSDLQINLEITPDRQSFLANIEYPQDVAGDSGGGEVTIELIVSRNGEVLNYIFESANIEPAVTEAYDKAIKEHLKFKPLEGKDIPEKIHCLITFPLIPSR